MVIYFTTFETDGTAFLPFLSENRLDRARAEKTSAARGRTIFSYALLRLAIAENFGITALPELAYEQRGKPFLRDYPDIFFNLSHASDAALCAVSEQPVGADIQDIRALKTDISRKICTPRELEQLSHAEDRNRELCRLWCMKESVGKLTGNGFAEGFTAIETEQLLREKKVFLYEESGFFISGCTKTAEKVNIKKLTEQELLSRLSFLQIEQKFTIK